MTTKPIRQTTQEPLDDEERELMNPDTWDWDNPVEVHVIGTPGAELRVRFTRDECLALARIAREAGVGPVAFIERTMLELIAAFDFRQPGSSLVAAPSAFSRPWPVSSPEQPSS